MSRWRGCRPEYFAVVLAAIEADLDDGVRLLGIQNATNTGSPLLSINGPVVKDLKLNSRGNVLGPGFRASATLGRALQFPRLCFADPIVETSQQIALCRKKPCAGRTRKAASASVARPC